MKQIADTALYNQYDQHRLLDPNVPNRLYLAQGPLPRQQLEAAIIRIHDNEEPEVVARCFGVNCNAMPKQITQSALLGRDYYTSPVGAVDAVEL